MNRDIEGSRTHHQTAIRTRQQVACTAPTRTSTPKISHVWLEYAGQLGSMRCSQVCQLGRSLLIAAWSSTVMFTGMGCLLRIASPWLQGFLRVREPGSSLTPTRGAHSLTHWGELSCITACPDISSKKETHLTIPRIDSWLIVVIYSTGPFRIQ